MFNTTMAGSINGGKDRSFMKIILHKTFKRHSMLIETLWEALNQLPSFSLEWLFVRKRGAHSEFLGGRMVYKFDKEK